MLGGYLTVFKRYPKVISFGLFALFFGCIGQTFFIGINAVHFREAFGLSSTEFGAIYSGATLFSACGILLLGHLIDRINLRIYTFVSALALALGCVLISQSTGLIVFVVGLALVRFMGQGVFSHMSSTVTARYVSEGRGRGLSLSSMGMPVAEMLLPPMLALILTYIGWRETWLGLAGFQLLIALPLLLWLAPPKEIEIDDAAEQAEQVEKSFHEVIRDSAFWAVLVGSVLLGFLLTGVFFHQNILMGALGISLAEYALAFSFFGMAHLAGSFFSGALVDRWGAIAVFHWFLGPFVLATLAFLYMPHFLTLVLFMVTSAGGAGLVNPARSAWLAENYGVKRLGAIKSILTSAGVLSTAISPALFGYVIDATPNSGEILFHLCWISSVAVMVLLRLKVR